MKTRYDIHTEQLRLQELKSYDIVNTLPQRELDAITRLAASICHTPVALITLVDKEVVWVKSRVGTDIDKVCREDAFCSLAIEQDDVFEVPDASHDPRFDENPLVTGDTSIRFYAGAPLVNAAGYALGVLSVVDQRPRVINDEQKEALKTLSKFVTDQFELRRTKQEAELNRNRYLKMLEDAGDIIYSCDMDGKFSYVNSRISKLIGHDSDAIIGQHFTSLISDEWKPKAKAFYLKQLVSRTPVSVFEFPVRASDGSLKWVEQTVTISLKDGKPESFQGVVRDIHRRKQAEEELARVNQIKEEFLANMSHEIRTPLNAVLGFAELLSETGLTHEQSEYVQAIDTSGKNLLSLSNDILDYSKIEAGMMRFENTPMNIRNMFTSLAVMFREKAKEKNIDVSFTTGANMPQLVSGDPTRLTQIIINLVTNALKFTSEGYVKISADCIRQTEEASSIRFTVSDSGIGISKDKLQFIFGRFNQASGDTTRKYGGSGLGLNIVKSLAELQGGEVSVESTTNVGSVFTITIPFKKVTEADMAGAQKEQKHLAKAARPLRVLIVDDNRVNQVLAEKVIRSFGFSADVAANGKEGIDLFKTHCYDVVLMDVQMPVMDGYEATELIRKELNSNVPVIAMTAHTIREEHEKCKKAGMNDHIGKPFKKEELYAKLMQLTHPEAEPVMTTEEKTNEKSERSRLLNLSQVQAMAGGDKAFVNEVLDIFIKDTPKAISTIEAGIQEKDYPAIKHWAHTLKSSMNLFGLKDTLGTILIQMEDMARNRQPLDEIGPLFNTLKSTGSQLIAEARLLRASA